MKIPSPRIFLQTVFGSLVVAQICWLAPAALAQSVPASAQNAFERGKIAAKQGDWGLALKYFNQAHKAASRVPVFLYALGSAHKETKHPVLAAIYFRAYLEAFPKAPNAERVRRNVLEQEIFIDRLVREIYGEALSTVKRIPRRGARKKHRISILESMARAGELEEVGRIGRLNPEGVPQALAALALKITQARFKEKVAVEPGVNPMELFKLSKKLSESEAVSAAKNFDTPWNKFACVVGDRSCSKRKESMKRKWKEEQRVRGWLREAENWVGLAYQMKKARLHGSAYITAQRALRLAARSGLSRQFSCARTVWDEAVVVDSVNGCIFLTAKGEDRRI